MPEMKRQYQDQEMPLLDHLEELRTRIIHSLIGLIIGMAISLVFSKRILDLLLIPTTRIDAPLHLQVLKVQGMFMVTLEIAFFGGIVLSLPYILYQIWLFIAPGLLEHERRYFPRLIFSATTLFLVGVAFSYFVVLPFALNFFIGLAPPEIKPNIAIDFYIGFAIRMLVIFGIIFELPVLSYFLSKIGILTPEIMRRYRRHAIVVIFISAAILTPPDIMTQVLLAIPLVLLYELSIWISGIVVRGKKAAAEAEANAADPPQESSQEENSST